MLKAATLALGLLLLAFCAAPERSADAPMNLEEQRAASLAAIDRQACEAKGGRVVQAGLLGLWGCEIPFADAGKLCSDDADCEGKCFFADDVSQGAAPGVAKGRCQPTNSPFGCRAEIRKGVVQPALCVD